MTISSNTASASYTGNGVTAIFPVPFYFLTDTDLKVSRRTAAGAVSVLTLNSDYTVSDAGNQAGGSVTTIPALPTGDQLFIERNVAAVQETAYPDNGVFPASSHEKALDRLTMLAQQVLTALGFKLGRGPLDISYDVGGNRLANVADAVNASDVPTLAQTQALVTGAAGGITPSDIALKSQLAGSGGASTVGFKQSGAGAVSRTLQDKGRELRTVTDNGAKGDGTADDGGAIASALADYAHVRFPGGTYANGSTAVSQPFGKVAEFDAGATVASSGSGSDTWGGVAIRKGNNPSALGSWTGTASYNFEGLSVDLGGYGLRQFGTFGIPTALNGSISIPSTSTISPHATAASGYVKNASTTTGGVALYGEANREADSALVWGLNTRTQDLGHGGLNAWGYEVDLNVDNTGTTAIGVECTGGSTVEPALSIAFQVSPIGVFASPKNRWQYGFRSRDAAAVVGMELGAKGETANSAGQDLRILYRDGSNASATGFTAQVDSGGNAVLTGGGSGALFELKAGGASSSGVRLNGNNLGFRGTFPIAKPTLAAAATDTTTTQALVNSIRTALINYGLCQ